MAIDKIFNNSSIDDLADNVLSEVDDFMLSVEKMQKRKVAGNVQLVIQSLRKIENDLRDEYGDVANKLSERISEIKNGQDGRNGADGRAGKDGRAGRDGIAGSKGADGLPGRDGIDGVDGVSVMDASIDFDGSLIISLSNGRVINVGEVVSQDLADKIQVISTMSTNGAVGIQDEGTTISSGVKNINFVGASVTSTASGDNVTVNIGAAGTGVFDAGTALLPSITTTGDLNTGVYFPAADTVGITTGGAQRGAFSSTGLAVTGKITSTGNVTVTDVSATGGAATAYLGTVSSALYLNTPTGNFGYLATGNNGVLTWQTGAVAITGTLSTTGVATFAAGTVALPSITTSGDTNTGVYFPAADSVGITAGGTQRGVFSSTGLAVTGAISATTTGKVGTTLGVGAATPSASGSGITFPATQSASTDVNTLDDYEEGTWTPNQGSGLTVVGAFSSVGAYVKIGRVVTVQGYLQGATSVSVAGGFNILTSNLPFSCSTNQTPAYAGNGAASAFAGTYVNALTIGSIETIAATPVIYFFATYYTTT